jgi:hypothetical protein
LKYAKSQNVVVTHRLSNVHKKLTLEWLSFICFRTAAHQEVSQSTAWLHGKCRLQDILKYLAMYEMLRRAHGQRCAQHQAPRRQHRHHHPVPLRGQALFRGLGLSYQQMSLFFGVHICARHTA